jgi:hypothetical protein
MMFWSGLVWFDGALTVTQVDGNPTLLAGPLGRMRKCFPGYLDVVDILDMERACDEAVLGGCVYFVYVVECYSHFFIKLNICPERLH